MREVLARFLFLISNSDILVLSARKSSTNFHNLVNSENPVHTASEVWSDLNHKYPFVVSLLLQPGDVLLRSCTGSLISKNFVLTDGHCCNPEPQFIRCGNMYISWNETKCKSKVLKIIRQLQSFEEQKRIVNYIGLIHVEDLAIETHGKLYLHNYKTLLGESVQYAGFGIMKYMKNSTSIEEALVHGDEPLQIGEGTIVNIVHEKGRGLGHPQLIVAPKYSKRNQMVYPGDFGGPLFINGQIVGVGCRIHPTLTANTRHLPGLFDYTPISPYFDWIKRVIMDFENN